MNTASDNLELRFERLIPASPQEVFDAWLSADKAGNPWSAADKAVLNAQVDGLFYLLLMGVGHYGRFVEIDRPTRVQHSWVSPATYGQESMVTATFTAQGNGTLMTLVHSGLSDTEKGKSHQGGWNFFLDKFNKTFEGVAE